MTDREKVIKGLECHMAMLACDKCPYYCGDTCSGIDDVVYDAIALLKAQEPVEPILKREAWNKYYNYYVCPVCGEDLVYEQNYCSECGRAVKWG